MQQVIFRERLFCQLTANPVLFQGDPGIARTSPPSHVSLLSLLFSGSVSASGFLTLPGGFLLAFYGPGSFLCLCGRCRFIWCCFRLRFRFRFSYCLACSLPAAAGSLLVSLSSLFRLPDSPVSLMGIPLLLISCVSFAQLLLFAVSAAQAAFAAFFALLRLK